MLSSIFFAIHLDQLWTANFVFRSFSFPFFSSFSISQSRSFFFLSLSLNLACFPLPSTSVNRMHLRLFFPPLRSYFVRLVRGLFSLLSFSLLSLQ
ncbi:hypothetical protein M407DRAFT_160199 [Tulasnella calospora MUT 4182]|uniref:Uncharacterized protein n=1 Tax=Tulasnella calospora MUT 4182 TaxID=1051891 RepID=A0A0C3Q4U1_9AGAM|nr:hypothetical protein M407DRAFT_160199 [Tulasnella calospora MUT 4182]